MLLQTHSDNVFSIAEFLSSGECASFIEHAEKEGFSAAGVRMQSGQQKMMPGIRNNDRLSIDSPKLADELWGKLSTIPLPQIDGLSAVGLASLFRFYRYVPGQRFKMHKDGSLKQGLFESKLSFLVYLNAGYDGGETDFRTFKIVPEEGMALLFIHDTWHEGSAVTNGMKYVLRSDVLYG